MLAQVAIVFVLFAEPGFPAVDVALPLPDFPGAVQVQTVAGLDSALAAPGAVLVWRHGSAFPAEAWPAIERFLERGGNLLYLGGEAFTRPVTGGPGSRVVGARTIAFLRALRLNQSYRIPVGGATLVFRPPHGAVPEQRLPADASAWELEPRLAETVTFPGEDGSPGARDAVVRPIAMLDRPGEDRRFPAASGCHAIDWLRGAYAGGRWVLRLTDAPLDEAERAVLIEESARPAVDFRVDPTLGTFHEGEAPSVIVRVTRPRAAAAVRYDVTLDLHAPDGKVRAVRAPVLVAQQEGTVRVPLPGTYRPGLYRVRAHARGLPDATTGFWVFDPRLFASGDSLSFDGYTLRRNGVPEPVIGTTLMSATVHRNFLFEPDAATWDDEFADLASLGVNLVRTGVWAGYQKISSEPHIVDEAFLRALEAYYLTARKHGIPVLFTFFAFVPESFGGVNPYFDPRALDGQRGYVGAVAARFAPAREMLWDLINEPSFSSPAKLWLARPNGDGFERAAFLAWLRKVYQPAHSEHAGPADTTWREIVRTRWRLLPDEPIGLPADEDFADRNLFGSARPYRARDYLRFTQDAFAGWIGEMRSAIRAAGSGGAINVGQDEGGIQDRPNPLFHHRDVEFTAMHTWWSNDALLWDGVMARGRDTPLLISETGIMQREVLSGTALRDSDAFARLLARKIAYAFAAGAFGAVQWIWDVNPYMNSDNEAAIGIRRADGSYKPELDAFRAFAGFVARNRARFASPADPEVVLLVPSAEMSGPRATQVRATRRAVDLLYGDLGVAAQVVSEYRAREDLGNPRLIILPATRGLSEEAWQVVRRAVERGAVLQASGFFEADDAGLPAVRLGVERRPLHLVEPLDIPGEAGPAVLRYDLDAAQSWYAAAGSAPTRRTIGRGTVIHYPVPLEWALNDDVQRSAYAASLREAGIAPARVRPTRQIPGVLVRALDFRDAMLVVLVSERSSSEVVTLEVAGRATPLAVWVPAGDARMLLVDREGRVLDSSHPLEGLPGS
jgi:hypothetical protein